LDGVKDVVVKLLSGEEDAAVSDPSSPNDPGRGLQFAPIDSTDPEEGFSSPVDVNGDGRPDRLTATR
jgi:hypothetical protein